MSKILDSFAEYMRRGRASKGLTQEGLAKILGVSRVSVASYEGGKQSPTLEVAVKIASELNISLDSLLQRPCVEASIQIQGLIESKNPDPEAVVGFWDALNEARSGLGKQ